MKIKKWIALLLAAVMLVSLSACSDSSSKRKAKKDGDLVTVYLVTEYSYDTMTAICIYDDDWNLIKIGSPDSGEENSYVEFTYDSDGNLIQMDSYYYGEKEYQVTFTYNERGKVVQRCEARFDNDEYVTDNVTEYEYDENGFLTRMSDYYPDYDSSSLSRFEYDEEGKLVREIREGSVVEYTYDKNGNMVLTAISNNSGTVYQLEYVLEYVYDEDGRLTHEYFVSDEGGQLSPETRPSESGEAPVIENIYEDDAFPVTSIFRQNGYEERIDLTYTKTQMTQEQANTLQRTFEEVSSSFFWPTVIIMK